MAKRTIITPQADTEKKAKLKAKLAAHRAHLTRWQTKLRRAFNTVEKHQAVCRRLEKQLEEIK